MIKILMLEFGHFPIEIALEDFFGSREPKRGDALDVRREHCGNSGKFVNNCSKILFGVLLFKF